jgi:hypothetical protein
MDLALFDAQELQRHSVDVEFQSCSLTGVSSSGSLSIAGLFAGIGGIELGLYESGATTTEHLREWWEPTQIVSWRIITAAVDLVVGTLTLIMFTSWKKSALA